MAGALKHSPTYQGLIREGRAEGLAAARGLVLKLDEQARTATVVTEYVHPDRLSAPTQGSFRELADGGSFIGWGQMPYFTEHAPDGTVRLAGHLPLDNQSYRAHKAEWAGERAPTVRLSPHSTFGKGL